MRIGIDVSQIVYQGSGIATYTQKLVENLLQLDQKNDYVLFGSSLRQRQKLKDFVQGKRAMAKLYPWPTLFLEKLWNNLHVYPIEKLIGEVAVFHSSDWLQPPAQAKKVTTVHDVIPFKYPASFSPRGGHDIVANQQRRLAWVKKEVALVMVDSQATKDDVLEILGIPAQKIRVVRLAADASFRPQPTAKIEQIKEQYGIKGDYLLNVGAREPRKNLAGVMEAFKLFSRTPRRRASLVIAGKQAWGENHEYRVPGIKYLGYVPSEDLPALYSGAACFVYPSFYEGFGLPVLEAMACGCPVVTTDRGSLAEIAGGAAVLVDPEKPAVIAAGINQAIQGQDKLRRQGIVQAKKFSWQKTAQAVRQVYEEVAGAH